MFRPSMTIEDTAEFMGKQGLLFYSPDPAGPISAGVQIDVNSVMRKTPDGREIEASICDHNCTAEVGGYDCGAALSRNKGVQARYAKVESIIRWILIARDALISANRKFVEQDFDGYCREYEIPANVAAVMHTNLLSTIIEVNLFGGNPEMHPEILFLIAKLRELGFRVNLTTTGRKIMMNEKFRLAIQNSGPHLIALSADDVDPDRLPAILDMDLKQIRQAWNDIPKTHGQQQKFMEAMWVLRHAKQQAEAGKYFPPILFNMVIHKGNVSRARTIMNSLQAVWEKVLINPYTAQTSFEGKPGPFDDADLRDYHDDVQYFIGEAKAGNTQFTRRLHYWNSHLTILRGNGNLPFSKSAMLAGYGTWHCGRRNKPGYLQIGRGNPDFLTPSTDGRESGGYPGCFWHDRTVTSPDQVSSLVQVEMYLLKHRKELADNAIQNCHGCVMPRLQFDQPELEYKFHPQLREAYLATRKEVVGF